MQLKKLCAICFAVLVAFSCSLVPAVIDTVYADDFVIGFKAGNGNTPVPLSNNVSFPTDYGVFFTWNSNTNQPVGTSITSTNFNPFNHDVTLYINIGYAWGSTSISALSVSMPNRYGDVKYIPYNSSNGAESTLSNGIYTCYPDNKPYSNTYMYRITIPAGATSIRCDLPIIYSSSKALQYFCVTYGGYIFDTTESTTLSLIEDILVQLRDMNVELDTQTSILNAISSYISNIDSNVDNIYDLLHEALASESAEVDSKSQQVAETIMQQDNAEQYWNDKNQDNFDAIGLDSFEFGGGVVNALGTVGNLFSSIWNVLGDATIIWTFPLMLGITLVAIGRVSRSGGKGKDKGGDKE